MYSVVPLKPGQVAMFVEVSVVASHGTEVEVTVEGVIELKTVQ